MNEEGRRILEQEHQEDFQAYRASHPENVVGTPEYNGKVTRQLEAQADAAAYRASHPENVVGTPEYNGKVTRQEEAQADAAAYRASHPENVIGTPEHTLKQQEAQSRANAIDRGAQENSTAGMRKTVPSTHTVESGDTLSSIVRGINSKAGANVMSVEALAILNGIPDPDVINTGQELTLTADKEAVDSCISSLTSWINNMNSIQSSIQSALDKADTNLSAVNTNFDNKISGLRSMMDGNFTNILADAEAFKSWMQELSSALEEETAYADTTIGNFASNPITHL